MDLWIRSAARTNLIKVRFLTIIEGKEFYNKLNPEYKGYTICNCTEQGEYEILGTYKTKERAIEVLDDIQDFINVKVNIKGVSPEITDLYIKGAILESMQKIYKMPEV